MDLAYWVTKPKFKILDANDIAAVVLMDLQPKKNELSVYVLNDPQVTIEQVVAAYNANRMPKDTSYVLLDSEELNRHGLEYEQKDSETPDSGVNKLHHNIHNLSAYGVIKVAKLIEGELNNKRYKTYVEADVLQLIIASLKNKHMKKIDVINKQKSTIERNATKNLLKLLEYIPD